MAHKSIKVGVPTEEGQISILFSRGGPREGAGRKPIGVTKKVSLTLSQEMWDELDKRRKELSCSQSELLRQLIESTLQS
ncbi:ribbon-helix-helix protein, CopG family [Paenibacillus sp. N1-5-1-14]|uniref:ribbon-helix-helix protein, CopG family n=1 Tax=Paenibacillus radicibacter TaxID=2972488 RepID=UPI00215915CD|nr:ribbon-helix-helix protein, CopG family [Paenibacillus radicibacter]MCR8642215.1 ribbon-helix-helix protein, CopG family [Paenibacillus radicibacter]